MSLSTSRLSASIRSGLLSASIGCIDGAALTAMCDAIASAVIAEITGHAVVNPTLLIAPGGMTPAPVTGTGTIT